MKGIYEMLAFEDVRVSSDTVQWIIGGVLAAISALLGILWKKVDNAVPFTVYDNNRKEMRENVMALHEKVEAIDNKAQERHNAVMTALLNLSKGH